MSFFTDTAAMSDTVFEHGMCLFFCLISLMNPLRTTIQLAGSLNHLRRCLQPETCGLGHLSSYNPS